MDLISKVKVSDTSYEIKDGTARQAIVTLNNELNGKADKATTLSGYGITDANIQNGVVTLGSNTITPLPYRLLATAGNYVTTTDKYLKLTMPLPSSPWMMTLGVVVYSGYNSEIYYIGGYNYQTTHNWYNPSVVYLSTSSSSKTIYFGKNDYNGGDGKLWVAIPVGTYCHVSLMDNSKNNSSFSIYDIEWSLLDSNKDNWDASTNGNISESRTIRGTGVINSLSTVATTGSYDDLSNLPTIPSVVLSNNYTPSTNSNEDLLLNRGDSFETAFSKLEKAILDNEATYATALNNLNSRIVALTSRIENLES